MKRIALITSPKMVYDLGDYTILIIMIILHKPIHSDLTYKKIGLIVVEALNKKMIEIEMTT